MSEELSVLKALQAKLEGIPSTAAPAVDATAATESAVLDRHANSLRERLRDALEEGDADSVIETERELRQLPILRRAVRIKELRSELAELPARFRQVKEDRDGLIELRREPMAQVERLRLELEKAEIAVQKFQGALYQTDLAEMKLHDQRRALNAELRELQEQINREVINGSDKS